MTPGDALRRRLADGACLPAPGVHDGLSARIAEAAGAPALYLGGNALGLSLGKGQPFVTATETADALVRINRAVTAPVIVDMGAGFGDAPHVHFTVRDIEAAGAAAIHIDDQPYPKPANYHRGQGRLDTPERTAAKLAVAAGARRSPDMMIIARTDALRVTGSLDDAIDRGRAFVQAGAEALMILDLTPAHAATVRAALPGVPLVWIGGVVAPIPSLDELTAAGFAMALYPFNGVAAVTTGLNDLWRGLMGSGRIAQSAELLQRAREETVSVADLATAWAIEDNS